MKHIASILCSLCIFFSASTAQADPLNLAQYQGKQAVYLDFWASWCVPCRESFPWLNLMQSRYSSRGLKIIAVNLDNDPDAASDFLAEYPAYFDIVFDPSGELASRYDIQGMPSSVLIDKQGNIFRQHVGFHGDKSAFYEDIIKRLLSEGYADAL